MTSPYKNSLGALHVVVYLQRGQKVVRKQNRDDIGGPVIYTRKKTNS